MFLQALGSLGTLRRYRGITTGDMASLIRDSIWGSQILMDLGRVRCLDFDFRFEILGLSSRVCNPLTSQQTP